MPAQTVTDGLDTLRVAGKVKRKRRKRTKSASTLRQIHAKARERQRAWVEGDRPNDTARLSADLNGPEHLLRPEGLFAEGRQEQAGEMEAGNPKTSGAFRG
jgi:hypothetical protein